MHKLFSGWHTDLIERLHECVRLAGSKADLARHSRLSLAQLYRYLNGAQVPQPARLFSIAEAAGMSFMWLLSGDDKNSKMPDGMCSLQTLREVYAVFEQALLEYDGRLTATQKAEILPLLVFAAEREKQQGSVPVLLERKIMVEALHFLQPLLARRQLGGYLRGMQQLQHAHPDGLELERFAAMVAEANKQLFSGRIGEIYYNRMGIGFPASRMVMLQRLYRQVVQAVGVYRQLRVLDMGCGNGRHLLYWHKHEQVTELAGVDGSALAIQEARRHTQGCKNIKLYQADVCDTGLPAGYFTFISCISVLNFLPYVPQTGIGAEALVAEAYRLLQPGGVLLLTARHGEGVEYLPFEQTYTHAQLLQLAQRQGFRVLHLQQEELAATAELCVPLKYRGTNIMLLQK